MSEFLPEPSAKHMSAQRAAVDTSTADAVTGLSSTLDFLGKRLSSSREERRVEDANAAIGAAASGILDLQDERSQLLLDEQAAEQSLSHIYEDKVVSEEEQFELDFMKSETDRLKKARVSGLLNPVEYSIRKNAMHKQALADVSHLGIQSNINALFGSNLAAGGPTQSPAEAKINQALDTQYGVGGWGVRERAQLVGNQVFVAQKMNEASATIAALDGQVSNVSTAINSGALSSLMSSIRKNGGLLDTNRDMYMNSVIGQFNAMEEKLEERITEARANGEPLDQEKVNRLRTDMAKERKYYTSDIFNEDLANTDVFTRIEKAQKIRQALIQANAPAAAQAALSLSMGGVGGQGGQDLLLAILDPSTKLEALIPSDSPVSAEQMKTSAQEALKYLLTADYSIEQQIKDGVISQALGTFISNSMIKKVDPSESPDTNSSFNSAIDGFGASSVSLRDPSEFTESVRAFGQHANRIASKGDKDAKDKAEGILKAQLKRVVNETRGADISIGEDGIPVLASLSSTRNPLGGRSRLGRDTLQTEMVTALVDTYKAYAAVGIVDMADLSELSTAEEFVPLDPVQSKNPVGRRGRSSVLTAQQLEKKLAEEQSNLPPLEDVEDGVYELDDGTQFTVVGGEIQ